MKEFGPHITIDLKGCPKDILSDYNLHFNFLKNLPELIGMTPITQPYVFPYSGLIPEDKGITGFCILAESHCSIHSFEEKGWSFIDIFSCKPIDTDLVIDHIKEFFGECEYDIKIVKRGIGFPR